MRRNPRLKKANTVTDFTPEQVQEIVKCAKDPIYFARNYVYIKHPTRGQIKFDLYDYQEDLMRSYQTNRYNIVLSARQTGKCVEYNTEVTVIEKPTTLRMCVLFILDRKLYRELKELFKNG